MEDSTPILIGAGQFTEKNVAPQEAHAPMGIAAQAARRALADTGLGAELTRLLDTLAVVRIFPDSFNRPRGPNSFGRAQNPPRAVARRLGANPLHAIYGNVGGNTPQKLISEMAEHISLGDVEVALITGSEAIKTAQTAMRQGIELDWEENDEGSQEDRGIGETLASAHEFLHGLGVPIQTYPLFENALRGKLGHSIDQHLLYMGKLFAPFSKIAAENPYSFYGTERSAEELAEVSEENRWICFPYPKWLNAMDGVNQGAAVVMTSVGKAKELGIDPGKWIFLHGCGEANEKLLVSERVDYHSSPAMRANSRIAFEMAGKTVADMNYIDIYSCFPSAVEIACDALGLDIADPRGLTLTGGLPFFGGPGNNYSMHAIATLVEKLRAKPKSFGLITANGGYLSKHATGIYSAIPTLGKWQRPSTNDCQQEIDSMPSPPFTETPTGTAIVETYTVCCKRGVPERGIVIGRMKSSGERFVANAPDEPALLRAMLSEEFLERSGVVEAGDSSGDEATVNRFIPD